MITIAVTTYNRNEMLQECLASIMRQDFSDFEVLIGNNFTDQVLSQDGLGLCDSRIRILNHPSNLGQLGNMNELLAQASGRYFTWLADDDMLIPQCLDAVESALRQHDFPKCVFCSYIDAPEYSPEPAADVSNCSRVMAGDEFVREYLARKLKLIGCYGGFETAYLRAVGGMRKLGDTFSPYADNLIAIEAGLQDRVAYIDTPLFFFRTHDQSLSFTSADLNAYTSAQLDLLSICEDIFSNPRLANDRRHNLYRLLAWFTGDIYSVAGRKQGVLSGEFLAHLRRLERYARRTGRYYPRFIAQNCRLVVNNIRNRIFKHKEVA